MPISIIAHDPAVLKQIGSWGWDPGLRPKPNAPVWPMSAFRNRFLTAFDSQAGDPVAGHGLRICTAPGASGWPAWTASGAWPRCTS